MRLDYILSLAGRRRSAARKPRGTRGRSALRVRTFSLSLLCVLGRLEMRDSARNSPAFSVRRLLDRIFWPGITAYVAIGIQVAIVQRRPGTKSALFFSTTFALSDVFESFNPPRLHRHRCVYVCVPHAVFGLIPRHGATAMVPQPPIFGRIWPHFGRLRPTSAKFGKMRQTLANLGQRPILADLIVRCWQIFSDFGPNLANLGQIWGNLAIFSKLD